MKMLYMSYESLTTEINRALDIYINALLNDGIITKEQESEMKLYKAVVHSDSLWGRVISKIMDSKPDEVYTTIVKLPNMEGKVIED